MSPCRRVAAVLGDEALAALRLRPPLGAEIVEVPLEGVLLGRGGQQPLDRRRGLLERVLRGGPDLGDLEDG
jgi:hypothetical protein